MATSSSVRCGSRSGRVAILVNNGGAHEHARVENSPASSSRRAAHDVTTAFPRRPGVSAHAAAERSGGDEEEWPRRRPLVVSVRLEQTAATLGFPASGPASSVTGAALQVGGPALHGVGTRRAWSRRPLRSSRCRF